MNPREALDAALVRYGAACDSSDFALAAKIMEEVDALREALPEKADAGPDPAKRQITREQLEMFHVKHPGVLVAVKCEGYYEFYGGDALTVALAIGKACSPLDADLGDVLRVQEFALTKTIADLVTAGHACAVCDPKAPRPLEVKADRPPPVKYKKGDKIVFTDYVGYLSIANPRAIQAGEHATIDKPSESNPYGYLVVVYDAETRRETAFWTESTKFKAREE